jgi:HPt (histidine-containing phosphotransfer) domain-containing protein
MANMSISFDAGRLTELGEDLGDQEFLQQTVAVYLAELPGRTAMMHHAVRTDDRRLLEESAHSLGSASAMLGALELADACRSVEQHAGTADMDSLMVLVDLWTSSVDRAEVALGQWLSTQGSNL